MKQQSGGATFLWGLTSPLTLKIHFVEGGKIGLKDRGENTGEAWRQDAYLSVNSILLHPSISWGRVALGMEAPDYEQGSLLTKSNEGRNRKEPRRFTAPPDMPRKGLNRRLEAKCCWLQRLLGRESVSEKPSKSSSFQTYETACCAPYLTNAQERGLGKNGAKWKKVRNERSETRERANKSRGCVLRFFSVAVSSLILSPRYVERTRSMRIDDGP